MKHLVALIKTVLKIEMSVEQYVLLWLLSHGHKKLAKDYMGMLKRLGINPFEFLRQLEARNYLTLIEGGKYRITNKGKSIFVNDFDAAGEFFDEYPGFLKSKDKTFPLASMDYLQFKTLYTSLVAGDADEHERMMEDLRYGIRNGLITMGMSKYFANKYYLKIRTMRGNSNNEPKTTVDHDF